MIAALIVVLVVLAAIGSVAFYSDRNDLKALSWQNSALNQLVSVLNQEVSEVEQQTVQVVTVTFTPTMTRTILTHQGLFELSFNQTARCNNLGFIAPWSVALSDGTSITEPPDANFSECCSASPQNPSSIVFYVPSGTYSFQIKPNLLFPTNGTVSISNQSVVVDVGQVISSCGSTTAS